MIFGGLIFLFGAVLKWGGIILLLRALYAGVVGFTTPESDPNRDRLFKLGTKTGVLGAVCMVASIPLVSAQHYTGLSPHQTSGALITLPLVWFVMPFTAWCLVVGAIYLVINGIRVALDSDRVLRLDRLRIISLWLLFEAICLYYYIAEEPHKFIVFKGVVPISLSMFIAIIILAIASCFAMAASSRSAIHRGFAKKTVTQIALVVGSIVFGIPFVWLVLTSFKEDVDLASPKGIVWIPKVTQTVPYMAPLTSPTRYSGEYKGEPFVGILKSHLSHGMVQIQTQSFKGRPGKLITVPFHQLSKIPAPDPHFEGYKDGVDFVGDIQAKNSNGSVLINVIHPQSIAGRTYNMRMNQLKQVPVDSNIVTTQLGTHAVKAMVIDESTDGTSYIRVLSPPSLKGLDSVVLTKDTKNVRHIGLRFKNYPDALDFLPASTHYGLTYLQNTLILVVMETIGTILSCSIVAYAFSRMRFPGKNFLFTLLLSTMMLPGAVTLMPTFIIFRYLGWINTLKPLWVPAFFASAFNVFMLRQFLSQIPMELEDAAKIDGCSYLRTFWQVMLPQIKPALAVIAIWTFMGAWNDFMGPLIYITSPTHMPLSYGLQLYYSDHGGEEGLLMAFATLTMLPVLALFAFTQKYFIEGVALSGFGGR